VQKTGELDRALPIIKIGPDYNIWYNLLAKEKPHHMVKNGPDEEYH
jgi:hypothetical protein